MTSRPYFEVIEKILEIYHVMFNVHLFKWKWIGNNADVQIKELGFIRVDLSKVAYMNEPFIMASQEK